MHKFWSALPKWTFRKPWPISFQILSDLHLELGQYSTFEVPAVAPNLILAGDIGRLIDYSQYLSFLARLVPHFDRIFLVLGNHEFYGLSYADGLCRAQELERESILVGKLILLHQHRIEFSRGSGDLVMLGCTLWSHVPEEKKLMVQMKVADFERIKNWTVDTHNLAHAADLEWLKDQVQQVAQES